MKKNMNQHDRYVRGIHRKMLGNLIFGIVIAIIIALCSCAQPEFAGEQERTKSVKNDSVVIKDSIKGFEPGNSEDVNLTEE